VEDVSMDITTIAAAAAVAKQHAVDVKAEMTLREKLLANKLRKVMQAKK
jgi:hypothetical protein